MTWELVQWAVQLAVVVALAALGAAIHAEHRLTVIEERKIDRLAAEKMIKAELTTMNTHLDYIWKQLDRLTGDRPCDARPIPHPRPERHGGSGDAP